MQRVKAFWNAFKNFAILFSFIVNFVLIFVLIIVLLQFYQLKSGILEPLIGGLHASFVGLDQATIDRVIPVRDEIPISFILPLEQNTNVRLTSPVPLSANAQFVLPGGGGNINGSVTIVLPEGLILPVALDLDVPVDTMVDVSLDVRAVIPLAETQLHDPFDNLIRLFDPLARLMDNLPGNSEEGQEFLNRLVNGLSGTGPMPDLLAPTEHTENPWPGFSTTAGDNYVWPSDTPPQPGQQTGTQPGGMEIWDVAPGAPSGQYISPFAAQNTGGPDTAVIPTGEPPEGDLGIITVTPETGEPGEESMPVTEGEAQATEEAAAPTVITGPPPEGDLGIITVTPAP